MGVLRDASRFVRVFVLVGAASLVVAYRRGTDPDWLAVGVLALGVLAVLVVAVRFSEDFEREE